MDELSPELLRARAKWTFTGEQRPDFAEQPGPGQESVWDYPRPPRVEQDSRHVEVYADSTLIADTRRALRVLETASPPTFYIPIEDTDTKYLERSSRASVCEWKGQAIYWSVRVGDALLQDAAWSYSAPFDGHEILTDHLGFFPARLDCRVDGERVAPQPGGFYGGWVTSEIIGPIKGEPGTGWW